MEKESCCFLAVFARAPVAGEVKTRLAKTLGEKAAAQLYGAMLRDVLCLGEAALKLLHCHSEMSVFYTPPDAFERASESLRSYWNGARWAQNAGDLGARLFACLNVLRQNDDDRVVVIGSDAPDLPPQFLVQAFEKLKSCDLIFGPAQDGGFYLIGASCKVPTRLFGDVRWSDAETLNDVLRNAQSCGLRYELLATWRDVDDESDLRALKLRLENNESAAPQANRVLDSLDRP